MNQMNQKLLEHICQISNNHQLYIYIDIFQLLYIFVFRSKLILFHQYVSTQINNFAIYAIHQQFELIQEDKYNYQGTNKSNKAKLSKLRYDCFHKQNKDPHLAFQLLNIINFWFQILLSKNKVSLKGIFKILSSIKIYKI